MGSPCEDSMHEDDRRTGTLPGPVFRLVLGDGYVTDNQTQRKDDPHKSAGLRSGFRSKAG